MSKPTACSHYVREMTPDGKPKLGKDGTPEWTLKGKAVSLEQKEALNAMRLPPAWTNVVVSTDPYSKIQAIGQDSVGRYQYRYSKAHIEKAAQEKFDRIKLFSKDIETIRKNYEYGMSTRDARAMLLRIEDLTAIRIGSDKDFKAKVKAYGLTTLLKDHVSVSGDKIIFDFIAKEGIPAHYEIVDKQVADWIRKRLKITKLGEPLFPDVSGPSLNDYLKWAAGEKEYTIKDFRTFHGTRIAYEEIIKYAGKTLTEKEKKDIIKATCEKVSIFLSNKPAQAKASYIDKRVWDIIGGE